MTSFGAASPHERSGRQATQRDVRAPRTHDDRHRVGIPRELRPDGGSRWPETGVVRDGSRPQRGER